MVIKSSDNNIRTCCFKGKVLATRNFNNFGVCAGCHLDYFTIFNIIDSILDGCIIYTIDIYRLCFTIIVFTIINRVDCDIECNITCQNFTNDISAPVTLNWNSVKTFAKVDIITTFRSKSKVQIF